MDRISHIALRRRAPMVAAVCLLALIGGGAAQAQTRVYRTPEPYAPPVWGAPRVSEEPAKSAEQQGAEDVLAGGPEQRAGRAATRTWSVRSSHVPADVEDPGSLPLAVIVDVDAESYASRRPRPPRRGPPRRPRP